MKYTVFEAATGKVLYAGVCQSEDSLAGALGEVLIGESYGEGYIQDGAHHPLPEPPTPHHIFDYTTKQWVDPRTPETEWELVRAQRNQLLQQSDWTQLPDVPLATKEAWAIYRQALRDVTDQPDPFNIVWPVAPG